MLTLSDIEKDRVLRLLTDLVRIDSAVTSNEQADRDRVEERMAEYLTDHLQAMGMTIERQEVVPGRPNLIASWPNQGAGGRSLMLEAHMDTVTVAGMTIDPFAAEIRDGRVWGRGTCDTKGSMAAFLTGLALAAEADRLPVDKLFFVASMSEETGCRGARALMEYGFRTDAAIVGEPTGCRLITAHKSPLWLTLETTGRSCHASAPDRGANAIDTMARVIGFVHGPWRERISSSRHPLLTPSTAAVTLIEGGTKINIIPAACRVQVDGRYVPGEPPERIVETFTRELLEYIGGSEAVRVAEWISHAGLNTDPEAPLAAALLKLCAEARGQRSPEGVNYFADTGPYSEAGITAVLFGPGDIAQAHTADEFLELDELFTATAVIRELLTRHAGRSILADR